MTDLDLDSRLERLAQATAGLRSMPGFADRVMLQVNLAATPGWLDAVSRLARSALVAGALLALTSLGWALHSDQSATEASAVAFSTLELSP